MFKHGSNGAGLLDNHMKQVERITKGHATRNDIVDDIVDVSSSTMAFNVAKIASARSSLTISLTKSLRVAGPLLSWRYHGNTTDIELKYFLNSVTLS